MRSSLICGRNEGEPRWVFDPEVNPEVELLHVSDEEAEEIIDHQHHLFDMNQGPLAHFQVIVTPTRKFVWCQVAILKLAPFVCQLS